MDDLKSEPGVTSAADPKDLAAIAGIDPKLLAAELARQQGLGSPQFGPKPSMKGSASESRKDPANSKMADYLAKGRPTDPAKQREYDMWERLHGKSKAGYEKGKTQSRTATKLEDIPDGAVIDPSRGGRHEKTPGVPLDERKTTHANWRMPQDPNQTNISTDDGRYSGGQHTLERYGREEGFAPQGEPYYDNGIWYQDYFDAGSNEVRAVALNDEGTPVNTPPANGGNPGPQTDISRAGKGGWLPDKVNDQMLGSGAAVPPPQSPMMANGANNLSMLDPEDILDLERGRRARRATRPISNQEALNTGRDPTR